MLPTVNQSGRGLHLTICHRALYGKRKKVVRQRHRKSAQPSAPRKRQKAANGRQPAKRRRGTISETGKQTVVGDNDSGVGTSVVGGGSSTRRGRNSGSNGESSESDHEEDEEEFEGDSEEGSGEESEEDSEGEGEDYEVNAILDKRVNAETSEFEYLINWVNFNDDWNTWEPAESLPGCEEVLDEFEDDAMDFRVCSVYDWKQKWLQQRRCATVWSLGTHNWCATTGETQAGKGCTAIPASCASIRTREEQEREAGGRW